MPNLCEQKDHADAVTDPPARDESCDYEEKPSAGDQRRYGGQGKQEPRILYQTMTDHTLAAALERGHDPYGLQQR